MTLKIKEGMYCVNRKGEKHGPMVRPDYPDKVFPWRADGHPYTERGGFFVGRESTRDLIAEWTDPAAEPEWTDWMNGEEFARCYKDGVDYQFQRINGVSQYRGRKAPPAPVVVTMLVDVVDGTPDMSTLRVQP